MGFGDLDFARREFSTYFAQPCHVLVMSQLVSKPLQVGQWFNEFI